MIGETATSGDARKTTPQLSSHPPSEMRNRRTSKPLVRPWCNGQPALFPETPARPPSDAFGARRALDQKETFHLSIHTTSGCPPSDPTSRHVAILIAQRLPPRRRRPLMWHFEWGFIESGFIGKKNLQHRLVQKLNSNLREKFEECKPAGAVETCHCLPRSSCDRLVHFQWQAVTGQVKGLTLYTMRELCLCLAFRLGWPQGLENRLAPSCWISVDNVSRRTLCPRVTWLDQWA